MHNLKISVFSAGILAVAAGFFCPVAGAAVRSWDGSDSTSWTTGTNWSGNTVPGSGDTASFDAAFTGSYQPTVNANSALGDIILKSTVTGNVTIGGSGKTLTMSSSTPVTTEASDYSLTIQSNLNFTSGNSKVFSVADGAQDVDLNITGNIVEPWYMNVQKTGAGTMLLSGSNSFSGTVNIDQGAVIAASNGALGATGTWGNTISSGGALYLTGGISVIEGGFAVSGSGPGGNGAIRNLSGNNTFSSQVTIGANNTLVQSDAGKLTMQGHVDTGGNTVLLNIAGGSIDFQATTSGTGTFEKIGAGTLDLNGGDFNAILYVREGTANLNRVLNSPSGNSPTVGTTSGPAATLRLGSSNVIRDDLFVNIKESGTFDLAGNSDSIAGLRMWGGAVTTGTGTLTVANAGGDVINTFASAQTATISGKLKSDLAQGMTITVEDGQAATDLDISAAMSGSVAKVTKYGEGTMKYSGSQSNTYTGQTVVDKGTLVLAKTSGATAIASNSLTVNSGGTVMLAGNNQISDSTAISLNGGVFSSGEGVGYSDQVGALTLSSSSTIDLGTGIHMLRFANSSSQIWNGTLTIYGWVGLAQNSGTQGQIFLGVGGLTAIQLANVTFDGFQPGAMLLASGELVPIGGGGPSPVPETKSVVAGLLLAGAIFWRERRRISSVFAMKKSRA